MPPGSQKRSEAPRVRALVTLRGQPFLKRTCGRKYCTLVVVCEFYILRELNPGPGVGAMGWVDRTDRPLDC